VPVTDLRLTSGGAASPFVRGLVAASAGLPVRAMGEAFGPALGAALLAARGTRRFATLADGVAAWIVPPRPEPPDVRETERLSALGTTLRSVRNALRATAMPRRRRVGRGDGSSRA
jgi:sugar (pentulose or hexulose) kinase